MQVFSVAARLRSVSRAARELSISQSSVSYHIRKLEDDLGAPLFRRTAAGLEPTEAGEILLSHVERGLAAIRAGVERVAGRPASLRVALLPMFASRWLSSRLGRFWEAHPDIQLSIQNHNNSYAGLEAPGAFADLGVQWGEGDWPAFEARRLWPEALVVVCSPAYLEAHPIRRPEDLAACKLLHVDDTRMWAEWFGRAGLALSPAQPQMMLVDRHFQLSSTINGLGVSLFAGWLVAEELREGRLVNPFGREFGTAFAYHLIAPRGALLPPAATRFRDWLLALPPPRPAGPGDPPQ